ncbi:MAG: hypothetical protein IT168_01260 [Bryobacterales bacterium]|nr:hypothetical protein [Bryobacterales bacterium]
MRVLAILTVLLLGQPAKAQIAVLGVTTSANFDNGVPARGALASLFVRGLDIAKVVEATTKPLPIELAGVRLTVGGVAAPILAVIPGSSYQQVNFQVPVDARFGSLDVEVILEAGGRLLTTYQATRPWSPGEFFADQNYYAILQHAADYSLVTRDAPAHAGETVVAYLTGLPMPDPPVPSGFAAPFDPLAVLPSYRRADSAEEYSVLLDGQAVAPLFIGLVPGLVGVFQINFAIPAQQAGGDRRLALLRSSCRALSGSCANGGGSWVRYNSTAVLVPIR